MMLKTARHIFSPHLKYVATLPCETFCLAVANLYPHIFGNFGRFIYLLKCRQLFDKHVCLSFLPFPVLSLPSRTAMSKTNNAPIVIIQWQIG